MNGYDEVCFVANDFHFSGEKKSDSFFSRKIINIALLMAGSNVRTSGLKGFGGRKTEIYLMLSKEKKYPLKLVKVVY